MDMNFRKWEYFLKSAETLNFTEAANQLCISPQALTQQIMSLEKELGGKLFIRTTRQISLSEMGEFCYQQMHPVKEHYDAVTEKIQKKFQGMKKILRLGFFDALPKKEIVNRWVSKVQEYFPDCEIELISENAADLRRDLYSGQVDMGVTIAGSEMCLDSYFTTTIRTVPGQVVISETHPWAKRKKITADDIAAADMLQIEQWYGRDTRENIDSIYATIRCRSIRKVKDFDSMLVMLNSGKYFAVFPNVYSEQNELNMRYLPLPDEYNCTYQVLCMVKKDTEKRTLIRFIKEMQNNTDYQV